MKILRCKSPQTLSGQVFSVDFKKKYFSGNSRFIKQQQDSLNRSLKANHLHIKPHISSNIWVYNLFLESTRHCTVDFLSAEGIFCLNNTLIQVKSIQHLQQQNEKNVSFCMKLSAAHLKLEENLPLLNRIVYVLLNSSLSHLLKL